jgi:hypothetical protein
VLSALVVVGSAAIYAADWYDERFRWREREYAKLQGLHAGYSLRRFQAVLGTPVFSRKRRGLREDSFRRRDHWIQAVSRRDGTVLLYSVTACDPEFRPAFDIAGTTTHVVQADDTVVVRPRAKVLLGDSTPSQVLPPELERSVRANYSWSGATGNTTLLDEWYGANPGNYKSFAWGLTDGCPNGTREVQRVLERTAFHKTYRGRAVRGGPSVTRFRRGATVNTYAETAPLVSFREVNAAFQTSVDRILTRTAE